MRVQQLTGYLVCLPLKKRIAHASATRLRRSRPTAPFRYSCSRGTMTGFWAQSRSTTFSADLRAMRLLATGLESPSPSRAICPRPFPPWSITPTAKWHLVAFRPDACQRISPHSACLKNADLPSRAMRKAICRLRASGGPIASMPILMRKGEVQIAFRANPSHQVSCWVRGLLRPLPQQPEPIV